MQDDIFPAAEKILSDIENVLKKNPSLKSFEIIPAEDNENKSPVFHQEDSLGLASCSKMAARRVALEPRCHNILEYATGIEPAESPLCTELDIATTCADRYASNYHAWSHRRHVMTLRESRGFSHPTMETEWKNSLAWCQRHVSDYSGLSYRQFLLRKHIFEFKELPREPYVKCPDLGEQCREELFAYIKSNIGETGDTRKLQRLLATTNSESAGEASQQGYFRALSYWVEECRANDSAICMYNDHEALWCHRRFLACLLVRFMASNLRSCQREECDTGSRSSNELIDVKNVQKTLETTIDQEALCHEFLVRAFRTRTDQIADLANKRDQHERMLVERFFKFLQSIGFEMRS
ncbi:Protein prenyltransferase alpha subunit repeat-containing protein 1 [Anthophora plagiata]